MSLFIKTYPHPTHDTRSTPCLYRPHPHIREKKLITHKSIFISIIPDCPANYFGVDCLQPCHCPIGSDCDSVSGMCSGGICDSDWYGPQCQCKFIIFISFKVSKGAFILRVINRALGYFTFITIKFKF